MAWNPPPKQAADPWATTSTGYSAAWPSSSSTAVPPQQSQSGWPAAAPARAAPQYPQAGGGGAWSSQQQWSAAPAPAPVQAAWPSGTSAPQWPSASNSQPQSTAAWPTTSPTAAGTTTAWPTTGSNLNTSASGWPSSGAPNGSSWSAAPQQQQQSSWGAPDPWATSAAAPPQSASAWGNTSALNQSGMSQPAAWQQQSSGYYGGNNSFQQSSAFNTSAANNSFQSAASFNPFDVTNDDAGFFANKPQTASRQAPPPSKGQDVPPPSATTQRLMRVASMLFERGALIKADKLLIQDMVLRGDKRAERALEVAERDGRVEEIHQAVVIERKKEAKRAAGDDSDTDSDDERAETAAASFKKRPSLARKNSDDDDDQTETLTDYRRQSTAVKGGAEAPHPAAGGYTGTVPPEMSVQQGMFVGSILMRISSKKMFRKWKQVFFALDLPRLSIYDNRREWEMRAAPKFVMPLHECMWIAKPTLKKTYSLIDDGRKVYYSTLKENSPSMIAQAAMAGMERPTNFSPALESRVVAKFGSHYPDEISAFAHAIYSVVLVHQREAKASGGGARNTSRQDSFRGGRS